MTIRDYITDKALKLAGLALGLAALGAACFGALAPAKAHAEEAHPLMWVIRDADSTIYLFGSIHVLKDDVQWLTPAVRQRFESADDLWLEIPDLDNTMVLVQNLQKYTLNPANDMTAGLSDAEIKKIDELAAPYGLSSKAFMGTKKWAVGLYLVTQKISSLGYNPKIGVDITLLDGARYFGKRVHGFETMDQQIQSLVPRNADEDAASLRAALKDVDTAQADLEPLMEAWKRGDEATLVRYLTEKMKGEDPVSYQRLIVARNAAWEPQVEEILKGKGTVFIAVGTAHLVGPDSVISMLKAHGIVAERVN